MEKQQAMITCVKYKCLLYPVCKYKQELECIYIHEYIASAKIPFQKDNITASLYFDLWEQFITPYFPKADLITYCYKEDNESALLSILSPYLIIGRQLLINRRPIDEYIRFKNFIIGS